MEESSDEVDVSTKIREGFAAASSAVSADEGGDPAGAVEHYRAAVTALQAALAANPTHPKAATLKKYAETYEARCTFLARAATEGGSPPSAGQEGGAAQGDLPAAPPGRAKLKPFWLMRVLERSVRCGGPITPLVHVPRELWHARDPKLPEVPAKVNALRAVLEALDKVQKALSGGVLMLEPLHMLYRDLAEVQTDLTKYLSYVPEVRGDAAELAQINKNKSFGQRMEMFGKFVATKTANASTVGGHTQYIQLLGDTLRSAGFLEPWVLRSLTPPAAQGALPQEMSHVLGLVADFFQQVICAMALNDLQLLLQSHLQYERANFEKAM